MLDRAVYIRHPDAQPIEVSPVAASDAPAASEQASVMRIVGLACRQAKQIAEGVMVRLVLPHIDDSQAFHGRVRWCLPRNPGYLVGIGIPAGDDVYALRQLEQLCHIEDYRERVAREEGRCLAAEEAANEWIAVYAARFPR